MQGSAAFRLNRIGVLLAVMSAGFAGEAAAAAGRVDFTTAGVTLTGRNGQARPLAKGVELDSGDTIRTNNEGRAQIRFTDGSYVSLQPNTDYAINDYKFEGKDDDRGFFGLVRGAMRTVTGAVGRVNRNSYRITTPTATVGIRGTGGRIEVLLDGSTLIAGTSGIWTLTNPSGTLDVPAGTFGRAPAAPDQPPRQTNQGPNTGPAPLPADPPKPLEAKYVQGDQVKADGTANIGVAPLVSGPGYGYVTAFVWSNTMRVQAGGDAFGTFDPAGRLLEVKAGSGETFKLDGTHADFGTDGILAWGRWVGNVTGKANIDGLLGVNESYNQNQGLHYVIGKPTPVMPTMGTATYSLAGATSPTYLNGGVAPGTLNSTSKLNVDFGAQSVTANLDLSIGGSGYHVNGTTLISGGKFATDTPTVTGTAGTACPNGCSGTFQGFFAGANAVRAGLGYRIQDSNGAQITGAAAFKKN